MRATSTHLISMITLLNIVPVQVLAQAPGGQGGQGAPNCHGGFAPPGTNGGAGNNGGGGGGGGGGGAGQGC